MPTRESKPLRNADKARSREVATELRPQAALVRKILRAQVSGNVAQNFRQRKLLNCLKCIFLKS